MRPKLLGTLIFWELNILWTKKVRGPNEVGDHFSYSQFVAYFHSKKKIHFPNIKENNYINFFLYFMFRLFFIADTSMCYFAHFAHKTRKNTLKSSIL